MSRKTRCTGRCSGNRPPPSNIFDSLPARIARIVGYERAADSVYPQDLRGDNLLEFMT